MARALRLVGIPLVSAGALLLMAAPATAHVEAEAQPARALATNALVTMLAESESVTAGITGVRIQLPAGLLASDFRLATGPTGWKVGGAKQVLEVRGPALPARQDLRFSVRVRQLPQSRQVVLKTIQSYSDGRSDSWIEVAGDDGKEPEFVAPVLKLSAAAPGATPQPRTTPSTAPPSPTATTAAPSSPPTSAVPRADVPATSDDGSADSALPWIGGAALLGLATAGVVVWRRRASTTST